MLFTTKGEDKPTGEGEGEEGKNAEEKGGEEEAKSEENA